MKTRRTCEERNAKRFRPTTNVKAATIKEISGALSSHSLTVSGGGFFELKLNWAVSATQSNRLKGINSHARVMPCHSQETTNSRGDTENQ